MSLGDPDDGMHRLFSGYLPRQLFVRPPEGMGHGRGEIRYSVEQAVDELATVLRDNAHEVAAFVCEPLLQGAGGFNFYPPAYLTEARRLCDEHGVLLVCDEVATGFGRTGTLFACEQARMTRTFSCWPRD
jgi:adenosylmethionine---8-amino-7-oxononanoate aminotransferase